MYIPKFFSNAAIVIAKHIKGFCVFVILILKISNIDPSGVFTHFVYSSFQTYFNFRLKAKGCPHVLEVLEWYLYLSL